MTTPFTTSSRFFSSSMLLHAFSYWARFLERTRRPSLSSFLQDQAFDLVADRDDLGGVDVVANGELARRDDALGLESDVEQDFVVVDLDHGAGDEIAVFELEDAVADEGGEVGADHVVFGDDARNVIPVFVKGSHLLGGEEAGAIRHAYFFHRPHRGQLGSREWVAGVNPSVNASRAAFSPWRRPSSRPSAALLPREH